jgi:D-alanyl-D-alanine carboxypeptidase/D-alanyl-D-alanine-endopeptidase (penicillin-binding protein 4)
MHLRLVLCSNILVCLFCFDGLLASTSASRSLEAKNLERLVKQVEKETDSAAKVGMQIMSMKSGRVVFSKNAQTPFIPASTMKVVTAAAALHYMGPYHRFHTTLTTDSVSIPKNGAIHHLYLTGSGDPNLSNANLASLVSEMRQHNVKRVTGNIIVDDTVFDRDRYGDGWNVGDLGRGYAAPVSGVDVEHNRIAIKIVPSTTQGHLARVALFPFTRYVKLHSTMKTGKKTSYYSAILLANLNKDIDQEGAIDAGVELDQVVRLQGQTPLGEKEHWVSLAVKNPSQYAGFLLKERLADAGIVFSGKIVVGSSKTAKTHLAEHSSKALSETLIDMLKFSDNHSAEALLKALGVKALGGQGSFAQGAKAVEDFLREQVKMDMRDVRVDDGSGLSRFNNLSPAQMVAVLRYLHSNFFYGPEIMAALPISGEDGTLYRSLNGTMRGRVRAKTGSMNGIFNLAGYMGTADGDVLAFTFFVNNSPKPLRATVEMWDKVLSAVDNHLPAPSSDHVVDTRLASDARSSSKATADVAGSKPIQDVGFAGPMKQVAGK